MQAALRLGLKADELATDRLWPERSEAPASALDRAARGLQHWARLRIGTALSQLAGRDGLNHPQARRLLRGVRAWSAPLQHRSPAELQAQAERLRAALRREGLRPDRVAEAFALVRACAQRQLGRRHRPGQLAAGWWLLQGTLVEMATGEGKTLAGTLPAATMALAGLPVHVVTANDYLAARDAADLAPLYAALGLRCTAVGPGLAPAERREAYRADIVYVSGQVLAFDYLRDRTGLRQRAGALHQAIDGLSAPPDGADTRPVLRGLAYALIDEADSLLIDEARTPYVLSGRLPMGPAERAQQAEAARRALALAAALEPGLHYQLDLARHSVRLTDAGRDALAQQLDPQGSTGPSRASTQTVEQALAAQQLYQRDRHYIVVQGQVRIVDAATGRAMPDRSWERGLHALIEAKEGLPPTAPTQTLARLTCQRLYRRYLRVAGMSGTVTEVAGEIAASYRLPVVRVPSHRPSRLALRPPRCLPDQAAKWAAVVDEVRRAAVDQARPVLVGTRSVADSMRLAQALAAAGLPHQVLNARQDADEAAVIAKAGEAGRITVATDMAGRGTDIALGPGVAERGGLHVVLTGHAPSRRIDRQLMGRAGRQGDPGSVATLVAPDDALFTEHAPSLARWLAPLLCRPGRLPRAALALLRHLAQRRAEALHRIARRMGERQDDAQRRMLAFTGTGE